MDICDFFLRFICDKIVRYMDDNLNWAILWGAHWMTFVKKYHAMATAAPEVVAIFDGITRKTKCVRDMIAKDFEQLEKIVNMTLTDAEMKKFLTRAKSYENISASAEARKAYDLSEAFDMALLGWCGRVLDVSNGGTTDECFTASETANAAFHTLMGRVAFSMEFKAQAQDSVEKLFNTLMGKLALHLNKAGKGFFLFVRVFFFIK